LDGRDYLLEIQEIDPLHYPDFENIEYDMSNFCSYIGNELEAAESEPVLIVKNSMAMWTLPVMIPGLPRIKTTLW
jgi:hypothetical protein